MYAGDGDAVAARLELSAARDDLSQIDAAHLLAEAERIAAAI